MPAGRWAGAEFEHLTLHAPLQAGDRKSNSFSVTVSRRLPGEGPRGEPGWGQLLQTGLERPLLLLLLLLLFTSFGGDAVVTFVVFSPQRGLQSFAGSPKVPRRAAPALPAFKAPSSFKAAQRLSVRL